MTDDLQEALYAARRLRLGELVDACGGPAGFVSELETRLRNYPELADSLHTYLNASYVSRASGRARDVKNIGEAPAMAFETLFEKPRGWLTGEALENFLMSKRRRRKAM